MISYYELLGMIKEDKAPRKIRVHLISTPKIYKKDDDIEEYCYYVIDDDEETNENYKYYLTESYLESMMFDKNIEIIEEEKELHANKIVFNCDNSKRECVINLDENDLGIDKLHIDNCYFYKENDKWYVRKYDFKTFNLEEKKIPEKLIPTSLKGIDDLDEKIDVAHIDTISAIETINKIIDYLKSNGE